jgi:alginate O-acetyltransferase complex protein AlgI
MVFSTPIFILCFLPIVLVIYYFRPIVLVLYNSRQLRLGNVTLVVFSLIFYAWGEPVVVLLMILSIVINWLFGMLMDIPALAVYLKRKTVLILSVVFNIGLLIIFKYTGFIVENINAVLGKTVLANPNISLPIGISFFIFQAMSYVIDVYRRDTPVNRNIMDVALYISFFPQLIAGPIVRYHDISEQIKRRTYSTSKFASGVSRFVIGLSKKALMANVMAKLCDAVFGLQGGSLTPALAWFGALAYMLQIYFDFSGYSDMAIGLAKMFGFELLENFNYPYISRSIREFWKRWHISLSTWFKDYLYIPLGGNRKGLARTYINQFVVMLLCGLWHGASWTFVVWGLYHALFLMLEKTAFGIFLRKLWRPLQHIYVLLIVLFGWVFFRAGSVEKAISFLGCMFGYSSGIKNPLLHYLTPEMILIFIVGIIGSAPIMPWLNRKISALPNLRLRNGILWGSSAINFILLLLSLAAVSGGTYNPFIYFRF